MLETSIKEKIDDGVYYNMDLYVLVLQHDLKQIKKMVDNQNRPIIDSDLYKKCETVTIQISSRCFVFFFPLLYSYRDVFK